MAFSGPREIRTLDLLNAIETRSQLRYGPNYHSYCTASGPGGIRTLDLFSAIEARSQLRYRPLIQGWIDFTLRIVECQANNNRVTGILLRYFF
jgi:hypothetical protein